MQSALRAMDQAQQGMQGNLSPEEMQRAAEEASRQLQGARDQVAQDQLADMQQTFDNMASASREMVRNQQRMEQQLQDAMAKAVKEREAGTDPNSRGMSLMEETALAEEKRQMAAELQKLQQDMMNAMAGLGKDMPQASNELQRANNELSDSELQQAVSDAALYIDAGYGLYIAGNESAVTAGIENLNERLEKAQELVADAGAAGDSDLDRARQQVEDLRAQLQQLAQGGQPGAQNGNQQNQQGEGQPDPNGQQQGAQPGQQQGQQQGQQPGQGGQQGQQQAGNNGGGGGDFRGGRRGGAWNDSLDGLNGPITLPDNFYDNVGNFTQQARDAIAGMDLTPEELNQMYEMLRQLEYTQANRNDEILAQEYGDMLALIEQLEVGLERAESGDDGDNVRTAQSDAVPQEYQESVAEYFRRLSREREQ